MNPTLPTNRMDTILGAQWRGSQRPWENKPKPPAVFVTVSREAGSGGNSFARILARKLNGSAPDGVVWNVFEGNLTTRMLEANQLPARFARFLPEDRVPEIPAYVGELMGLHPSLWELVQKTNETIRRLARQGAMILVGRGANFATAGLEGGVHVRLIAPVEHRARYLAQLYNISEAEALAYNAKCDAARRRYVRAHFSAEIADPLAYDLIFNSGRMTLDEAAEQLAAHIRARTPTREV